MSAVDNEKDSLPRLALRAKQHERSPRCLRCWRLVFTFNRRDHGRLRMLLDHLDDLPG